MRDRLNKVFSPDNLLWTIVSRGVDIVGLSLLWAFLSMGIVTIGPATAALYYTVVKCFRQKEKRTFRIYWDSFRACLKKGNPIRWWSWPIPSAASPSLPAPRWGRSWSRHFL